MKQISLVDVSNWTYTSTIIMGIGKALILFNYLDDMGRINSEFRVYSNTTDWDKRKLELRSKILTDSVNFYNNLT